MKWKSSPTNFEAYDRSLLVASTLSMSTRVRNGEPHVKWNDLAKACAGALQNFCGSMLVTIAAFASAHDWNSNNRCMHECPLSCVTMCVLVCMPPCVCVCLCTHVSLNIRNIRVCISFCPSQYPNMHLFVIPVRVPAAAIKCLSKCE